MLSQFIYKSATIIPVAFMLLLCGIGCQTKTGETAGKNVFRINYSSGNLESIDPAFAKDLYSMWTMHMVYNTLVETDEHLQLVPSLAKSWEVTDDGLRYTFHLRSDVRFHDNPCFAHGDGRKMIAQDVVYSFNRLIDPAIASSGAWIFNDRVRAKEPFIAVDDSTLQIYLIKPFRPLPQILSMPYCSVVPHEAVEKFGKDYRAHPCGTGPFQFNYWDEGNVLVLRKNQHYWEHDSAGVQLPYIDAVQVSFVDSKATEFLMFMQKKLDFINSIDGSFKDLVLSKDGTLKKEYQNKFRLTKSTYLNNEYIGFLTDTANEVMKNSPTRNVLVRRAMNYAIDRNKIATYFRNGVVQPATSGFIPPGLPGYDSGAHFGYHYDPAKALELLKKAGYPNGKGMQPITILAPDNYMDIVNFVVTELQDLGIPAKAEAMQPNILRQQMSRSQAIMFRAQWIADYPDAETYLCFFNSHFPAPPNYTRFSDKTFDRWYDESLNAPDTVRWKMYEQMDSLATSYAPVLDMFYDRMLHFTQSNITGFKSNPMNLIDVKGVRVR